MTGHKVLCGDLIYKWTKVSTVFRIATLKFSPIAGILYEKNVKPLWFLSFVFYP